MKKDKKEKNINISEESKSEKKAKKEDSGVPFLILKIAIV